MVIKFRRCVYSFWHDPRTWQTERRTDTACWHRPRLCIASRGKNDALHGLGRSTTVEDVIFQDQVQDLDLRVRSKLKRAFVPALIQASS